MSKGAATAAGQRVSAALRMARAELLLYMVQPTETGWTDLCSHKNLDSLTLMSGAPDNEQRSAYSPLKS